LNPPAKPSGRGCDEDAAHKFYSPDLLPCPFCGGVAKFTEGRDEFRFFVVTCQECFAQTESDHLRSVAIERWNRRSPTPEKP